MSTEQIYESPCEFHLQLWHGEWVIWGYGPYTPDGWNVRHVAPAVVKLGKGRAPIVELPFKLPERYKGGDEPQEYERVTGWGWQFRSDDMRVDTGWHVAETREQAILDAVAYAEGEDARDGWVRSGHREPFAHAARNVRQYQCLFD